MSTKCASAELGCQGLSNRRVVRTFNGAHADVDGGALLREQGEGGGGRLGRDLGRCFLLQGVSAGLRTGGWVPLPSGFWGSTWRVAAGLAFLNAVKHSAPAREVGNKVLSALTRSVSRHSENALYKLGRVLHCGARAGKAAKLRQRRVTCGSWDIPEFSLETSGK